MRIIQLFLPSLWRCGHATLHSSRPPWHNHHRVLLPSHDLRTSSFKYSYWQVCKQKAPFLLWLTSKFRGFLTIQICGHLSGIFFFCAHKVLHKLSSSSLLKWDRLQQPRHPMAGCGSFVAYHYPVKLICNFTDKHKPELTPSTRIKFHNSYSGYNFCNAHLSILDEK